MSWSPVNLPVSSCRATPSGSATGPRPRSFDCRRSVRAHDAASPCPHSQSSRAHVRRCRGWRGLGDRARQPRRLAHRPENQSHDSNRPAVLPVGCRRQRRWDLGSGASARCLVIPASLSRDLLLSRGFESAPLVPSSLKIPTTRGFFRSSFAGAKMSLARARPAELHRPIPRVSDHPGRAWRRRQPDSVIHPIASRAYPDARAAVTGEPGPRRWLPCKSHRKGRRSPSRASWHLT